MPGTKLKCYHTFYFQIFTESYEWDRNFSTITRPYETSSNIELTPGTYSIKMDNA